MNVMPQSRRFQLSGTALASACVLAIQVSMIAKCGAQQEQLRRETSVQAFHAVASVLISPRCLNCHTSGSGPLQGDDNHPHIMNVRRGVDGTGSPALHCSACHQRENARFLHGPPGAADWHLPPARTPMAWQGLSEGAVCRELKDPAQNGNRSLPDLVAHMNTSLVLWAWNPGPGRTSPPLSHDEFLAQLKQWIDSGAACPQ